MPRQSKPPSTSTGKKKPELVDGRLPVNPRRKKVLPEERKRVSSACNNCNVRRVKCTGETPCHQCRNTNRPCKYPEVVPKVTVPKLQWTALTALQAWAPHAIELKRQLEAGELVRKITHEDGRVEYQPASELPPLPELSHFQDEVSPEDVVNAESSRPPLPPAPAPQTAAPLPQPPTPRQQQQQEQHHHYLLQQPPQQQQRQQQQQQHHQHHIAEHQHRERPPLGESPQTGDKLDKIRSASPSTSSILSKRSDFYLSTSTGFDPRSDEGRMLADSTGTSRYLGASSGATFLDNIKNMITLTTPLAALISKGPEHMFSQTTGRYQTDDSRALLGPPLMDPVRHLPPAPDMAKLLDEVRYFIQDGTTDDLFPSGGIMFWSFPTFTDLSALGTARRDRIVTAHGEQYLQVPRDDEQRTPLALTFAAFAFNSLLGLAGKDSRVNGRLGEDFYATSRHLLGDPWDFGTSTIKEAAVMGLLALYLVEINRRDNAHLWVKHAMHVCEVRGIHRGYTDDEAEVRTFWTLYIIDSWLSCLLGRTPSIPDDGISLRPPRECPHFPSPVGLKAHLELSRITHKIIYNGLRRQSDGKKPEDRRARAESHVKRSLESLKKWLKALPPALQLPPDAHTKLHLPNSLTTEEVPSGFGRDRACWSLHMSYNQLIILTVRPVILTAVRKAIASLVSTGQMFNIYDNALVEEIRWCTDAAQSNLRLGWLMRQNSPHGRLLVQDLHHIFNAAVFLTMYQLVFVNVRTQLVADVDWAIDVFKQEQETGCAYAKDCFEVLRDLRFLVSELRDWIHNQTEKEKLWDDDGALKNYLGAMTAPRNNNTSKTDLGADVPMHDVQFEGRPIKQAHGFKKGYARRIWDTLTSWLLLEDNSNEGDGGGECFVFLSSSSSDTNSNCSFPLGGY
ncbi:hypothetical protein QC763_404290 [Podospora pseudopauciseta]|uniref:Zn(2)-C6 fungal-type domain-containing protein n=1 Tax=Podospora pseudopauciseta TaxID=2093780 RepID=A0ABR0HE89_9PEZI|nr:hypothetical protein QC763_404290 [Podospora pseudopauciseta]